MGRKNPEECFDGALESFGMKLEFAANEQQHAGLTDVEMLSGA